MIAADELPTAAGKSLRPSVETTMHAVMPPRVVIHVHSVKHDRRGRAQGCNRSSDPRWTGLRWEWVSYLHPGFRWPGESRRYSVRSPMCSCLATRIGGRRGRL
jgi:rhamnose utilization protein RhaD (predicted bifunctional aldolase and dehydrogenase)